MEMKKMYAPVTNSQELTAALARCRAAQAEFATFTQEQDQLYFRFEAAKNALGALQQEQFFYDVFLFSRELMR